MSKKVFNKHASMFQNKGNNDRYATQIINEPQKLITAVSSLNKGDYDAECNRTSCDNQNAKYYNFSTKRYYCTHCASIINLHNYKDSIELYGHALCIYGEHKES